MYFSMFQKQILNLGKLSIQANLENLVQLMKEHYILISTQILKKLSYQLSRTLVYKLCIDLGLILNKLNNLESIRHNYHKDQQIFDSLVCFQVDMKLPYT